MLLRPCTDLFNMGRFRLRQLTKEQEGGWEISILIYVIYMLCSIPSISSSVFDMLECCSYDTVLSTLRPAKLPS